MNTRTFMRNSGLTRARRADPPCPFAKNWCGQFALLLVFWVTLISYVAPSAAQEPKPYCVSCGPGYHCVHNPEGCEPDESPQKQQELRRPQQQPLQRPIDPAARAVEEAQRRAAAQAAAEAQARANEKARQEAFLRNKQKLLRKLRVNSSPPTEYPREPDTGTTTGTAPVLKTGNASDQTTNPRIQAIQASMKELKSKIPPPIEDASLSFENLSPDKKSAWLLDLGDYVIYAWGVYGRIGSKPLLYTNLLMIAGKVVLAGGHGADLYLIGQNKLYDDAARYLKKDSVTARKFARLLQDLRQGRPIPTTTDPAMLRAAKAILDPALNHSHPLRVTWDLMMTPDAKLAMVRKAVFEMGLYFLGEGTEGIASDLTRRAELYETARVYRNMARNELKTATEEVEQEALKKVIAENNAALTDLYKQQQFWPKTSSYLEGVFMPESAPDNHEAK